MRDGCCSANNIVVVVYISYDEYNNSWVNLMTNNLITNQDILLLYQIYMEYVANTHGASTLAVLHRGQIDTKKKRSR